MMYFFPVRSYGQDKPDLYGSQRNGVEIEWKIDGKIVEIKWKAEISFKKASFRLKTPEVLYLCILFKELS